MKEDFLTDACRRLHMKKKAFAKYLGVTTQSLSMRTKRGTIDELKGDFIDFLDEREKKIDKILKEKF